MVSEYGSDNSEIRDILQFEGIQYMKLSFHGKELANKGESFEICFVPDNDYRGFLKRRVPELEEQVKGGNFIDTEGKIIGIHEGYPFYTVGQRKGLGKAFGYPAFVTEIRKETNEVVIGKLEDLNRTGMYVGQLNLQKYSV